MTSHEGHVITAWSHTLYVGQSSLGIISLEDLAPLLIFKIKMMMITASFVCVCGIYCAPAQGRQL